jgi:hypothetical protein
MMSETIVIIGDDDSDADQLIDDLAGIVFDEARCAAILVDREYASEDGAQGSAAGADAETVERVVIADPAFHDCRRELAENTDSGLPRCAHSTNIQASAATAVAICVTVIAMPACTPGHGRTRVEAEPADP